MNRIFLSVIFIFCAGSSEAQPGDSVRRHIDSSLSIMQRSLYAKRVDWKQARQQVYAATANVYTVQETFPALAKVYKQLGDHHGWFEQYSDKIKLEDSVTFKRLTPSIKAEWAKGPVVKAKMIGGVAYLRVPTMPAYTQKQVDMYANWLLDSIAALNRQSPKAWIIDLRMNSGGNIVAMMSALACFFDNGLLSYYINADGEVSSQSLIRQGHFLLDDTVQANLKTPLPNLRKVKVAILIGAGTASSAEGVAYHFRDRKRTKVFGEPSAGVANSTEGFLYNEGNSYFLLTTGQIGTRKKKPLPEQVSPDIYVHNNDAFTDLPRDNAVRAALNWLRVKKNK